MLYRIRVGWLALLAAGTASLACFNDGGDDVYIKGGTARLALVIEADRSDVDATHFLLDTATGDLWCLEAGGQGPGRWRRLAEGPADLRELELDDLLPGHGSEEEEAI